ncbi:MAG: serine protease AprX [Hyphomicrobiales bacterium]|jgi:subtilisin family serine protease|nr:serine protease AprX [Hyphomicrobiales bacterium]
MASKYRVIAFGMHETEINAAMTILSQPERTEAFALGEADDAQIAQLEQKGLIVQKTEIDAGGGSLDVLLETPGLGASPVPGLKRNTAFTTSRVSPSDEVDLTRPNIYLLHVRGPLLPAFRNQLDALGVELLERFGGDSYTARLNESQAAAVRGLPFIISATIYDARHTVPGAFTDLAPLSEAVASQDSRRSLTIDLRLHRPEDLPSVTSWLKDRNIAIAGSSARKIRIYVLEGDDVLSAIAALPEIQSFEEFVPPKFANDRARHLMTINGAAGAVLPFDGTGQIVGVADSGLDDSHADFQGRMVATIARGRPGNATDPHGHGTHVAGSVLGDGSASGGSFKGTAPGAKLVFQSLLDSAGGLGGLPLDLGDLFEEAYLQGARIHNNSWGSATSSTYTFNSSEVDEYVGKRRDMLVVFSAGNEGQAANRINAPVGFVDWLSIGSPATAKNALTVGAGRSDRTSGGLSTFTWSQAWPSDFPDPPIANDRISGNPECLAGFSSRGPSDDRRIKPDVVAPGTDILSCKSKIAPLKNFWGPFAANPQYAFMGGTSMAAPLTSGCAALVREYFHSTQNHHDPSAALIRATLINGARWLTGVDANNSNPPPATPPANFDQGFGCIDMANSVPHPAAPNLTLAFVDNWKKSGDQFRQTGERRRYSVTVKAGRSLRICLAYTDAPGRGLQNNLNLFVQTPGGQKLMGNHQLRHSLGIPDVDNNIEIVRIANPQAGPYLIQITATNLLHVPQDFALVVTGDLQGGLTPT